MGFTQEQLEALAKIKEKSEDDYEKNLVYIAAGTLVLSMTFLEKIVNLSESSAVPILIGSWVLLAFTLLGNLVSHQLSSAYHSECRLLYAACCEDLPDDASAEDKAKDEAAHKKADSRMSRCNDILIGINWGTTITLFLGIFLLVIFCSINAYNASHKSNDNKNKTDMAKESKPKPYEVDQTRGRTISAPLKPAQSQQGASSSSNNGNSNRK